MSRWATMLGLGGVAGFCSVSALRLAAEAGLLDNAPAIMNVLAPFDQAVKAMPANQTAAFSALFAAVTVGAGSAIFSIAGYGAPGVLRSPTRLQRGEAFAAATLAALVAFYGTATAIDSPVAALFGAGPGFLFSMALCFAALLFDRMMDLEDEGSSDAAFQAALETIRAAEREALRQNWRDGVSGDREVR